MPGQLNRALWDPFGQSSVLDSSRQFQNNQNEGATVAADVPMGPQQAGAAPADAVLPLNIWGDDQETEARPGGGGAAVPDVLPSGQTITDGCQTLESIDGLRVPATEPSQDPSQVALDTAHAEVAVSADPLRQQTEQLQASVLEDAALASTNAAAEVARLEALAQDPNSNGQVFAVDGDAGDRTYYENVTDAEGRTIHRRVHVDPSTGQTTTETVTHDPSNLEAPYTYQMEAVALDGENAHVARRESTYDQAPALNLSPNDHTGFSSFEPALTESQIFESTDAQGASVQRDEIIRNEYGEVVGGSTSRLAAREGTVDQIGAPGNTEAVFDPNQSVYSVQSSNHDMATGQTINTTETGQGQTLVSALNTGDGPTSIVVQQQTDDNTKITQQFVQGSSETVVTETTVEGNQVTEQSVIWDKPEGYPAERIGTSDTTRIYGDDGKLQQQDERIVNLETGELTDRRTTREVNGTEVVYNTSTYHEAADQESTVTYGRQTTELGLDGTESLRSTQLNTPDGQSITVTTQPGEPTTATLSGPNGNQVSGSLEAGADGGTVLTIRDDSTDPATTQEIHINPDGSLVNPASLTEEQKSLVPTLLSIGETGASLGSSGLGSLAKLRDPAQAAALPETLRQLGIDPAGFNPLQLGSDGLGLLSGIFAMGSAITDLNTPGNNNTRTMFDLAGSGANSLSSLAAFGEGVGQALGGGQLAAVKMLGTASIFLGGISGAIGAGAGVYDFLNAESRFDQADGAIGIATGLGGVGVAGAMLAGATPPGWVVAAIAGLGLLGTAVVDGMRSQYLPPVYQELLDPSQQQNPEYQ